ncbi:ras-specific guanine nucleotide-releasing factor 2 [Trichonephila clavata]|uniref:Ras-specific guanine nucleotide-releasing factor 2 n=1 Tax=Trichonephila clavata TaxID=2740835 RepID=A0A8X6K920_TRICU|nr:ras-specific guanine nucleotide-releasing factor 2 [Trichonephila clavata]
MFMLLKNSAKKLCKNATEYIITLIFIPFSFSKILLQKEELEQKHLHLVQIVESEKTAKWQYTQQCEELTIEIKKLRAELNALKREWRLTPSKSEEEESEEIRKIKKVQSFFRGWLCRRRWKQIVAEYISSPHAENMRKRNSLVFRMVESEEEYVEQLQLMVSCFLRPFKMAASSQKPPCTHDERDSDVSTSDIYQRTDSEDGELADLSFR